MKRILINLFLRKEWLSYLVALFLGYVLTVLLFLVLNNYYDTRLKAALLEKDSPLSNAQIELGYKYHHLTNNDGTYWKKNDTKYNNDRFEELWKAMENDARDTEEYKLLTNIMMYSDDTKDKILSYGQVKNSVLFPYIAAPNVSLNDVMSRLQWEPLETLFGSDGIDNVKRFFSEGLSHQLDLLKLNSAYTNRRYLNGSIQFITIWVAFMGILMLLFFMVSIGIERKALLEGISSFELPTNMDTHKINQLEETLSALRENQKTHHSKLKEMLINTINTFVWRGKEEAENTLDLEIKELRENMDSRFGMIKYFAWAVPSIGFIGTVIGIGSALGNAHNVIGQTAEYQTKGQIQLITGQLGVAFDTTLVALILSIVLVLLIHVLTRREEHLISSAVSAVKRELLQKIAPLERTNKLRRFNLLLEFLKSYTSPEELQTQPFLGLKNHLEEELNPNNNRG